MRKKIKRTVISVLGIFFVLLGILGLVMPFLQGFFFLAIGLILISIYSPSLRGWIKTQRDSIAAKATAGSAGATLPG